MSAVRGDLAINIGKNVKALRERAKINQERLAEYLGLKQETVSMCEKGERNFSTEMLERLAELFGCTSDSLLQPEVPPETLDYAFRTDNSQEVDLKAISTINRIALNLLEMQRLMKKGNEFVVSQVRN
ncbi:MAG: helix-turn-helix transcriptional regulator [Chloroflexi bacterium]|nr:helix-turn-helix transcriptional regulator [Chloroflexota bacterium]